MCQRHRDKGKATKTIINEAEFNRKKMFLFQKGKAKVLQEMDCVTILTKIRLLELLVSLFLTDRQKFLLKFQKRHVLNLNQDNQQDEYSVGNSSSSAEEEWQNPIKMYKEDCVCNKDQMDEEQLEYTLKSFLTHQSIEKTDNNLLLGLVSRNLQRLIEEKKREP